MKRIIKYYIESTIEIFSKIKKLKKQFASNRNKNLPGTDKKRKSVYMKNQIFYLNICKNLEKPYLYIIIKFVVIYFNY